MIISHEYRYLFVEVPHAGTAAVSQELCANYAGHRVLQQHSHHFEFLRCATPEEKTYFVFSGVRNPLDEAVRIYLNYKHTAPASLARNDDGVSLSNLRRYAFIRNNKADFGTYFKKFYQLPYTSLGSLSHQYSNYVLRFESLQEDFSTLLDLLGIGQRRPLPTASNTADFLSYYTPEVIGQARWVFGPFMERWNYAFPTEWGSDSVHWMSHAEFHVLEELRTFYWKRLKRKSNVAAERTGVSSEFVREELLPQPVSLRNSCGTLDGS